MGGAAGSLLMVGMPSTFVLAGVLAYEFFFGLSLGPCYFVVATEVLSDDRRADGLGASLLVSRLTACASVLTFQVKNKLLTMAGTFYVYSALMLLGAIFVMRTLPETSNRKFEDIQQMLSDSG